jgi:hypothetical protein
MATSHAYDAWADGNLDPLPMDLSAAERDTALSTLKDVLALTGEDLPDADVRHRVAKIARATLALFGETDGDPLADADGFAEIGPQLQEEMTEPASGWFEDEPPDTAA